MAVAGVLDVLGGEEFFSGSISNHMDLIALGDRGVSKSALIRLTKYLNISVKQMAEILAITERTIQRYTLQRHFNHLVSEQILKIAQVASRGTEVFGEKKNFLLWMNQPNKAMSNTPPMELLRSQFGTDLILEELGRIEHGVFS